MMGPLFLFYLCLIALIILHWISHGRRTWEWVEWSFYICLSIVNHIIHWERALDTSSQQTSVIGFIHSP